MYGSESVRKPDRNKANSLPPFCPYIRKVKKRPLFTIKKLLREIFFFPSHLCLDAPLVAIVWVLALRDLSSGKVLPLAPLAGLGFSIWGIYLFDRLLDVRSEEGNESPSSRHRFTSRHPGLFFGLIACSIAGCLICLPHVSPPVVIGAGVLASATLAYYGIFRLFPWSNLLPVGVPWKELTIAILFVGGIFLCLQPFGSPLLGVVVGLILLLLFLGNCLTIALAESDRDRQFDAAGFYSHSTKGASVTLSVLPLVALALSVSILFREPRIGVALASTSSLCLFLYRSHRIPSEYVQATTDLALLLPPGLLLGSQWLLSR